MIDAPKRINRGICVGIWAVALVSCIPNARLAAQAELFVSDVLTAVGHHTRTKFAEAVVVIHPTIVCDGGECESRQYTSWESSYLSLFENVLAASVFTGAQENALDKTGAFVMVNFGWPNQLDDNSAKVTMRYWYTGSIVLVDVMLAREADGWAVVGEKVVGIT